MSQEVARLVEMRLAELRAAEKYTRELNARLAAGETVTMQVGVGGQIGELAFLEKLNALLATAPPEQAAVRTDSLEQPDHYDNVQPPISTTIGVIPCSTHTEIAKPIPGMTAYIPEQQPQAASAGALSAEQLRLLKLGHCPWDAERSSYDEEAEQVVHCHADADGYCNWAYCPQPLLAALAAHDQKVRAEATLAEHKSHVDFENELYATLVDPVAEGSIKEAEMRKQLLEQARWYRQRVYDLEQVLPLDARRLKMILLDIIVLADAGKWKGQLSTVNYARAALAAPAASKPEAAKRAEEKA